MKLELAGQAALVTGAARGIGAAIAGELGREGCDVALLDLERSPGAEAVALGIRRSGRRAITLAADVSDFPAAEASVAETVRELGRLDILVCNAGIVLDGMSWKLSQASWDAVLAVNLTGCFAYCRAAAPVLRKQGRGRVITIASINGIRGKAGQANYVASKAGVIGLTKTLARELGPSGVTVNCVAPGMVRTEMTERIPAEAKGQAILESALGRLAEPEDIAHLVAFLCSERARHITGQVIKVDGGQYL